MIGLILDKYLEMDYIKEQVLKVVKIFSKPRFDSLDVIMRGFDV